MANWKTLIESMHASVMQILVGEAATHRGEEGNISFALAVN